MKFGDLKKPFRLGVVADTHVSDRVGALHPDIIPTFKENQVELIIHAGDISSLDVLTELEKVAPVVATKGNRDYWHLNNLPEQTIINVNNNHILINHGQGNWISYFFDKLPLLLFGYNIKRFQKKFLKNEQEFDIVIFGHSHVAENQWINGKLYFNPGCAYDSGFDRQGPSIGLLELSNHKVISSKIIKLSPMRWSKGKWNPI